MFRLFPPYHSHWRHQRHWRRMGMGRLLLGLLFAPLIFKRAMCWHGGGWGRGYGYGHHGHGGCHGGCRGGWGGGWGGGPRHEWGERREWRGGPYGPHGPDYV